MPAAVIQEQTNEFNEANNFTAVSSISSCDGSHQLVVVNKQIDRAKIVADSLLSVCVSQHLFPNKKFITKENEIAYGSKVQKIVCNKLNIGKEEEAKYWEGAKETVRKKLVKKRNNVMEQIKKDMSGKK